MNKYIYEIKIMHWIESNDARHKKQQTKRTPKVCTGMSVS